MSSSQSRSNGVERAFHQDYIARIRYSNALPPPPHPAKLLDIPNTGLGQYTAPGFASRLVRELPLNIEADAELGMPLDLVGMPGVFDGDESSIQAPSKVPPVHPHDRLLLRPLSALGKLNTIDSSVSFLRRTEYISSLTTKPRVDPRLARGTDPFIKKRPEKRKVSPEPDQGSPAWIKRRIEKSFEAAARNLADRSKVRHPTKRNVKLVEAYPLVPDLDAFPDSGAYVTVKFSTNPVAPSDRYDTRLLAGIFKPIERSSAEDKQYADALLAHESDPVNNPKPHNMMNYDLFLAKDADTAARYRKKFDVDNPDRESDDLYSSDKYFRFSRLRAYETSQEKEFDHDTKYADEVILAFREDEQVAGRKAAFYYPVIQRSTIRNQRTRNIARTIGIADEEETHMDELQIQVEEPSDGLKADLLRLKENPIGFDFMPPDGEEEQEEQEEQQEQSVAAKTQQDQAVADKTQEERESGSRPEVNGHSQAADGGSDQDAEGDED